MLWDRRQILIHVSLAGGLLLRNRIGNYVILLLGDMMLRGEELLRLLDLALDLVDMLLIGLAAGTLGIDDHKKLGLMSKEKRSGGGGCTS